MKSCILYLVRHGQTEWNVKRIIQGHTNIPLNEVGEQQAHAQRKNLKSVNFSRIYSSDLIRAHRTAKILNLERQLAIETTKALRERYFGDYEGESSEEGRAQLWKLLSNYTEHPKLKQSRVENNESVIGRVFTFLREISVAHPGENILVATHGGVLRLTLIHLGYAKEETFPPGAIQNLAYIKLESDGVEFRVLGTSGITLAR